jgi:hypothetical protein
MATFMSILFYLYVVFINLLYGLAYIYPLILLALFIWTLLVLLKNNAKKRAVQWVLFNTGVALIYWMFFNLQQVFDFLSIPYDVTKGIYEPKIIFYTLLLHALLLYYYNKSRKLTSSYQKKY